MGISSWSARYPSDTIPLNMEMGYLRMLDEWWNLDRRSIYPAYQLCSEVVKETAYLGCTELMHTLISSQGETVVQDSYRVSSALIEKEIAYP